MTRETAICSLPGPLLHRSRAAKAGQSTAVIETVGYAVTDGDANADADADAAVQQTATISA